GLPSTPNWTAESNQSYAYFGISVGRAGDVNGDGCDDVIIAAGDYNHGEVDEGAVFVWYGCPLGPSGTPENADWMAETNQAGNSPFYFIMVADTAGDVNGDGCDDVLFMAGEYDHPEADEGAVFVWYGCPLGENGTPENADWMAETNQAGAGCGGAAGAGSGGYVAGSSGCGYAAGTVGDVNGDGYDDVFVGVGYYDHGESNEGAVFVWYGSAAGLGENGTPENADWTAEGNQAGAYFGASAGAAGDVNGDGYDDVIIGAPDYDHGQADEGAAFVYLADEVPPSSQASSPAYDNGGPIPVSWQAADNLSGVATTTLWYRFNDYRWVRTDLVQSGTSGTFYFSPPNGDGVYDFATQSADRAGNVEPAPTGGGDTRTVYDTTRPAVRNLQASPNPFSPNGDGVRDAITITAEVEDTNFRRWSLSVPGTDCSYQGTNPLLRVVWDGKRCKEGGGRVPDGPYEVRITAYDRAGNSSFTWTVIVLDTFPPTLTVTFPPQPAYTHHDRILVAGGTDSTANTITVNGEVISHTTEAFSTTIALTAGRNLLTVAAADPAGNSTVLTRTVLYEVEPPLILSYAPTGAISEGQPLLTAAFADAGGSGVDTEAVTLT
ncbi:MAG: FG-GAP-like repeat-containing protein, partial [Chloroflexia bacterium]